MIGWDDYFVSFFIWRVSSALLTGHGHKGSVLLALWQNRWCFSYIQFYAARVEDGPGFHDLCQQPMNWQYKDNMIWAVSPDGYAHVWVNGTGKPWRKKLKSQNIGG